MSVISQRQSLSTSMQKLIQEVEYLMVNNTHLRLQIAFIMVEEMIFYKLCRKLVQQINEGKLTVDEFSEDHRTNFYIHHLGQI